VRSDGPPETIDGLVLAAARIAEDLIARCSPSEEALFAFAAGVVTAGRSPDRRAASLAFELATGLLDNAPAGHAWSETRGRLSTTKLFAWLLMQSQPAVASGPETRLSTEISGYIRDTLTLGKQAADQT
jgi:hypothetical protein